MRKGTFSFFSIIIIFALFAKTVRCFGWEFRVFSFVIFFFFWNIFLVFLDGVNIYNGWN